jgi:hypothetical protein
MEKGPDGTGDRSPPLLGSYSDFNERTSISDSEFAPLEPLVIELLEPIESVLPGFLAILPARASGDGRIAQMGSRAAMTLLTS